MAKRKQRKPLELLEPEFIGLVERPSMLCYHNTTTFEEWTGKARINGADGPAYVVRVYKPVLKEN